MSFSRTFFITVFVLSDVVSCAVAHAKDRDDGIEGEVNRMLRFGIEYYSPVENDRDIRTININAFSPLQKGTSQILSFYAGLTATYAAGEITQLEGELAQGTLREVEYDSEAVGIGPGIEANLRLMRAGNVSLNLNGSGSIILYNRDFPAGGERYNFMWRGGMTLDYVFDHKHRIGLSYRWMHVSNGQGMDAKNPSYEGQGISINYQLPFY